MSDFVKPEVTRLPLNGGQFVDVKKRLNHGESEDMYARMSPFVTSEGHVQVARGEVRTTKVLAYLIGWSLTSDGAPVPMSPALPEAERLATIRALDPDRFREIHKAIERHEDAMSTAREAEKKSEDGAQPSKVILPSPVSVIGATSGSVS